MAESTYTRDGDYVIENRDTGTQVAQIRGHIPARHLRLDLDDGTITNDGADTETVTVDVVSGLEVARGTAAEDASTLDVDDDATLIVDGREVTVPLSGGTGSTTITSTASAGSTIEIVAEELSSYPAETDSVEIEVVSA